MKYRQLGDSGIEVSEIAYGSWLNFAEGDAKRTAIACVHRALDLGINFLDTANGNACTKWQQIAHQAGEPRR